jgi:hypothetical protein
MWADRVERELLAPALDCLPSCGIYVRDGGVPKCAAMIDVNDAGVCQRRDSKPGRGTNRVRGSQRRRQYLTGFSEKAKAVLGAQSERDVSKDDRVNLVSTGSKM